MVQQRSHAFWKPWILLPPDWRREGPSSLLSVQKPPSLMVWGCMSHLHLLDIWYVLYFLLWIKYGFMGFTNHGVLFLLTFSFYSFNCLDFFTFKICCSSSLFDPLVVKVLWYYEGVVVIWKAFVPRQNSFKTNDSCFKWKIIKKEQLYNQLHQKLIQNEWILSV